MADFSDSEPRRQAYLDCIRRGLSHKQTQEELDVRRDTYLTWRKRYHGWKIEVDLALAAARQANGVVTELGAQATLEDKRLVYFGMESYWHHRQMIEAVNTCPLGGVVLILLPPEHGKSTVLHQLCTIWIAEDPNIRIGYVTETLALSRKAVGRVEGYLEAQAAALLPRLHADHGPFQDIGRNSRPWTSDYFVVLKRDSFEADYTMEARAAKGNIAGTRMDKMVVDDVQSLHNIADTKMLVQRIRQDFFTRVKSSGVTIIIGTRVEDIDVYSELIDEGVVDRIVMLPATNGELVDCPLGDACHIPDIPHEQPLCPEMWPVHDLAVKRRLVGEVAWARNYQQRPGDATEATFTEQMILDARDFSTTRRDCLTKLRQWRRMATLDPAVVGGCSLTGFHASSLHCRVIGQERRFNMARSENIIAMVDEHWLLWGGFETLVVEANSYQKALANDERLIDLGRTRGFRIVPHTTGINKLDQTLGVAQMASSMSEGTMTWIWGDDDLRKEMAVMEAELLRWRSDVPTKKLRQDTVMSLWFGWLHWQKHKASWADADLRVNRPQTAHQLPWRPQGMRDVRALSIGRRGV